MAWSINCACIARNWPTSCSSTFAEALQFVPALSQKPTKMPNTTYRTAPLNTDKMPPGILYIVGNEAAERFSYYGMNCILVPFMTLFLLNRAGRPDHMTEPQAEAWYHTFVSCLYFLPLLGAFLGDAILGRYRTILFLSIVYCFGHLALAIDHTRVGL